MLPASGNGLTAITAEALTEPQLLVTVYKIVSMPAVIPVTSPSITVAVVLLAVQTPPVAASVNIIAEPAHTLPGPDMLPAVMDAPIVT
jgi:hypothetical protein